MTERAASDRRQAWYIVGFLSLLYGLSIIDRLALALLAEPVMKTFALSASQMALLLGVGFALLYSLTGLPLAHVLDRRRRKYIVAGGVALWSLSTLLSAFARDFPELLICRSGVAIGEAVLTPAAISLIGDLFEPDRRRLPISVYSSISSLMATGSYIVAAAALDLATQWSAGAGLAPWRLTLIIVGLPGLVLAAVFALTTREPQRRWTESDAGRAEPASAAEVWGYISAHRRFYLPFYTALGAISALLYSILSWVPTYVSQSQGLSTADAGYLVGLVGMIAGLCGTFLWPAAADRIQRARSRDGLLMVILACVVLGATGAYVAGAAETRFWLMTGLAMAMVALPPVSTVLSSLLIQRYGPASMRARLIAANVLMVNLVGYTIGPQFVGFYLDASSGATIGGAIAWLAALAGPLALVMFFWSSRSLSLIEAPAATAGLGGHVEEARARV